MSEWKSIGAEPLLEEGGLAEVKVGGARIVVAKVEGIYYAVQAFCSHMGGAFASGNLEGYVVSCPRNVSRFDVRNGQVVEWLSRMPGVLRQAITCVQHPKALQTYATRVAEGQVWVEV